MSEQKRTNQLDGIIVNMNWYCGICKQPWSSYINQGDIRRMPSYKKINGKRVETRRPDGSMFRAHEDCATRYLKYLEEKSSREKKVIITP